MAFTILPSASARASASAPASRFTFSRLIRRRTASSSARPMSSKRQCAKSRALIGFPAKSPPPRFVPSPKSATSTSLRPPQSSRWPPALCASPSTPRNAPSPPAKPPSSTTVTSSSAAAGSAERRFLLDFFSEKAEKGFENRRELATSTMVQGPNYPPTSAHLASECGRKEGTGTIKNMIPKKFFSYQKLITKKPLNEEFFFLLFARFVTLSAHAAGPQNIE